MAARKRTSTARLAEIAQSEDPVHIREIRNLEAEVRSQRATVANEQSKRRQAEEELADSLQREALLLAARGPRRRAKIQPARRRKSKSPAVPIIAATDWHAEGTVDPETVSGLNEYNLDIFRERVGRLWQKSSYLIELWRTVADIREAVLWLGGDLISGSIHPELEESNSLGPTQAIIEIQQRVAEGIEHLLDNTGIEWLHVVTSNGNHGRTTQKPRIATGYRHSLEWLAYNSLASLLKDDKRVSFTIATGYHNYVNVLGHTVRFHHGDSIRYHGGVGGITIPTAKAIAQWNKSRRADLDVFGHYHQFVDMWTWVCCGSLIGIDPYAISIKCDYQPPTQTFIVLDEQYGKVAALPIYLGEDRAKQAAN